MKPAYFKGYNVEFAKDQPQYQRLPAHRAVNGRVTCCWHLTWRERLRLLWTGEIWQQILTFNTHLQPQKLMVEKPKL